MNFLILVRRITYTLFFLVTIINFFSKIDVLYILNLTLLIFLCFYELIVIVDLKTKPIEDGTVVRDGLSDFEGSDHEKLLKNKIENCLDSNKYNEDFINIVRYLLQTNEYLSTNYTLGDLENSYGISKKQISEIIYQNTGNNFTNLIAKLRINYAKTLIEAKMPYTFDYLSSQVGFCSRSSFYKYFKYFEGVTPKEYQLKLN